jgi:hypothetical protein
MSDRDYFEGAEARALHFLGFPACLMAYRCSTFSVLRYSFAKAQYKSMKRKEKKKNSFFLSSIGKSQKIKKAIEFNAKE